MGFRFYGLLDSGASCTILGKGGLDLIKKLGLVGRSTNVAAKTVDGTLHKAICVVDVSFRIKNKVRVISALVVPSLTKELILGIDFWQAFSIRPQFTSIDIDCALVESTVSDNFDRICLSVAENEKLDQVIGKFVVSNDDFLGCTNLILHTIDTGNAEPVVKRAYPVSPYIQKAIDLELDRMLKLDIIETSCSEWANPLVAVKKPTGAVRLCLDARNLNEKTRKDRYPVQHIWRILQQIKATKYLSQIDLKDAFWQVMLEKDSRPKTAFNVPGRGHFQFKRMPFGLCNSAQTLCKALDRAIGTDLEPFVFVYIDDIIITADSFDHHVYLLEQVAK